MLDSPFFGSGKLEYYLAARRPGLEVRGVDAFEPVANLHRCHSCRARVLIRPAAQQLLGKVGLLRTAEATGTEQRAASAAATTVRHQDALAYLRALPPGAPVHLR